MTRVAQSHLYPSVAQKKAILDFCRKSRRVSDQNKHFQDPVEEWIYFKENEYLGVFRHRATLLLERVIERCTRKPVIVVDFLNDDRVNACAVPLDCAGNPFYAILINKGILNEISNALSGPSVFLRAFPNVPHENREIFELLCNALAFDALVYHEVAHIVNGHCSLPIGSGADACALQEHITASSPTSGSAESLIRQSQEMDADAFSMTHQLQDFVQYRDDPNIPTASKEHLRLMSNDDLITAAVILNLVVFWTIDPRGSGDVDEMHRSSHPHPLMRLYMNAETVLACAARVLDLPHSATVETLRNTQLGVIHTLGKGAGINRSIGINLKDDIARIYVPYRDNLRTVWQERRKQLMKVKYYPDLQTHLL